MTDEQIALCLPLQLLDAPWGAVRAFARRVEAAARREERERCAKVADAADKSTHPAEIADAIRALPDKETGNG